MRSEHPISKDLPAAFDGQVGDLEVPDAGPVPPLHGLVRIRACMHRNDDTSMALDRQPVQDFTMVVRIHLIYPIQKDHQPVPPGLVGVLEEKLETGDEVDKVGGDDEVKVEPAGDHVAQPLKDGPDIPGPGGGPNEVVDDNVALEVPLVSQSIHDVGHKSGQADPGLAMHDQRRSLELWITIV